MTLDKTCGSIAAVSPDSMLIAEPDAHTVCEKIYIHLQRICAEQTQAGHEDAIIRLANQLMAVTQTYGPFFVALDEQIEQRNYAGALKIGQALLEHEAILHSLLGLKPFRHNFTVN